MSATLTLIPALTETYFLPSIYCGLEGDPSACEFAASNSNRILSLSTFRSEPFWLAGSRAHQSVTTLVRQFMMYRFIEIRHLPMRSLLLLFFFLFQFDSFVDTPEGNAQTMHEVDVQTKHQNYQYLFEKRWQSYVEGIDDASRYFRIASDQVEKFTKVASAWREKIHRKSGLEPVQYSVRKWYPSIERTKAKLFRRR